LAIEVVVVTADDGHLVNAAAHQWNNLDLICVAHGNLGNGQGDDIQVTIAGNEGNIGMPLSRFIVDLHNVRVAVLLAVFVIKVKLVLEKLLLSRTSILVWILAVATLYCK
jgi:hypothetical protein